MSSGAKTDAKSKPGRPPRDWASVREWLDVAAKLIGALAIAGVTYFASMYQSKASITSVINQREQAESELRAGMLRDLVEPIIGKNGAVSENADLQRQLLLAEMVTLNFHDHFEFKPLLQEVDARLLVQDMDGHKKIASVARRVVDRQINMLRSVDGISRSGDNNGYRAKLTRIDLWNSKNPLPPPNCTIEREIDGKLTLPATICVASPDNKACLLLVLYSPDYIKKSVVMRTSIYPNLNKTEDCSPRSTKEIGQEIAKKINEQDRVQLLDEATLSIFDFPLTDNAKVIFEENEYRYEYRYAVSLYRIDSDIQEIILKLVWFPEGYVTERERPPQLVKSLK